MRQQSMMNGKSCPVVSVVSVVAMLNKWKVLSTFYYWMLMLLLLLLLCGSTTSGALLLKVTTTPPLLDVPTYALATQNDDGFTTNMNILTYATPISIRPDRVWSIGLVKGSLTHENFQRTKRGILQLLREPHSKLIPCLGGTSGHDGDDNNNVNKQTICNELGFPWMSLPSSTTTTSSSSSSSKDEDSHKDNNNPLVLPGCAYYLQLSLLLDELIDAGSHDVALCRVDGMYVDDDDNDGETETSSYLSTQQLRDMGIITPQGRVASNKE